MYRGISLAILGILFAAQVIAGALSGTVVSAPVVPATDQDTYPSHIANYGKGGYVQYQYSTQMRSRSAFRNQSGMVAYVKENDTEYRWSGTTWVPKPTSGGHTIQTSTGINLPQRAVLQCYSGLQCEDAGGKTRARINRSSDGGFAASTYLIEQSLNGGTAQ